MKIVEIASSVVDSISHLATLPIGLPNWTNDLSPSRILTHLDSLMSSFRHKAAKGLIELLCQKTAEVHARTGYCPPLSNRSLLDNKNNEQPQNSIDGDDDKFYQRPTLLSLPTFDDALSSMETSLLLGSANDDYSDQHRDNIPSIDIDSLGRLPAIFDQYIGQDTMRSSQEISESALNPVISLLVGSNEGSVSTLTPFTPDHYELGNDSPGEALF